MRVDNNTPSTIRPAIKKIDIHTHIIPEEWPDWNKRFGYSGWLTIQHDPSSGVNPPAIPALATL